MNVFVLCLTSFLFTASGYVLWLFGVKNTGCALAGVGVAVWLLALVVARRQEREHEGR
jgi:hypothetical protein